VKEVSTEHYIHAFSTDRSASIKKLMREKFPSISHQFDPWLMTKTLLKKIAPIAKKKETSNLNDWARHLANHLWYSAESCKGDPDLLIEKWTSCLYHIQGIHSWVGEKGDVRKCDHEELANEREIAWLSPNSKSFQELAKIVTDRNFLADMRHLHLNLFTSKLENYHALILKYATKRLHFHETGMSTRMQLSVMDHNCNAGRKVTGQQNRYRKATDKIAIVNVKEKKDHFWKGEIIIRCLVNIRDETPVPQNKTVTRK
jgi:hypothetical protein